VYFYRINDPSGQTYRTTRIDLMHHGTLDVSRVHLHPNGHIDLVAIDVTDKAYDPQEHIEFSAYARSYLTTFDKVQAWQTDLTDQVIALGYPLGIRSLRNNCPIAKMGYLASRAGQEISIPFPAQNRAGNRVNVTIEGKYLVVDG